MKILAIDYGEKRIGLALSDTTHTLARPLPYLPAAAPKQLLPQLQEIIQQEEVGRILVGLPRHMDGSEGESAQKVQVWVQQLQPHLAVPVELVDERWSTQQAARQLRETGRRAHQQREVIDSTSAAILLQAYLDAQAIRQQMMSACEEEWDES